MQLNYIGIVIGNITIEQLFDKMIMNNVKMTTNCRKEKKKISIHNGNIRIFDNDNFIII